MYYTHLKGIPYFLVAILYRKISLLNGCSDSVTTMREVYYGVISQGVAPYFLWEEIKFVLFLDIEIYE